MQARQYFGCRAFAEIDGFTFSAFTVGMAAGPMLMGFGFDSAGSCRTALFALIVMLAAAVAATWPLPDYDAEAPRRAAAAGSGRAN